MTDLNWLHLQCILAAHCACKNLFTDEQLASAVHSPVDRIARAKLHIFFFKWGMRCLFKIESESGDIQDSPLYISNMNARVLANRFIYSNCIYKIVPTPKPQNEQSPKMNERFG